MSAALSGLLLGVVGLDLYVASTSRLGARIRACALQGVLLGCVPLTTLGPSPSLERLAQMGLAALATLLLKAVIIPLFLRRAMRATGITREVAPFVSLHLALLFCAGLVGLAFWLGATVLPPSPGVSPLGVPVGLATLLVGLYLTVGGHQELTQVVGYLVAENGVFVIGQTLLGEFPLVVELGVLLDVLVAVMLMAVLFVRVVREEPTEHAPEPEPEPQPGASAGGEP